MKPYLLVSGDFVTTGGMDRANHALASYLARRGDEVHLVAHRVAEDLLRIPNVIFHPVPKLVGSYFLASPLLDGVGRLWAKRVSNRGGRVVVNGGNCQWGDINWVHYVHAAYAPRSAGGLARQIKTHWSHQLFLSAERHALRAARHLVVNSHRTKADLVNRLGISASRVHVVYYGTAPDTFRPPTQEERIAIRGRLGWRGGRLMGLFVGSLGDQRKGFDVLFEAWKLLCARSEWDVDLAVVGVGAELPGWKARATNAGMAHRFHFLGFRRDVPELLQACDVLIAPTRYEAYGLNVLEALCAGLPAFTSADAGVAEAYPPELSGFLMSPPLHPSDLAARLFLWRASAAPVAEQFRDISSRLRSRSWEDMAREFQLVVER